MSENTNKNTDIISRRSAREQAFILLFEMCFCQDDFSIDLVKENALDSRDVEFCDYAEKVAAELTANGILNTVDNRSEKIGYKIREARLSKLPYMLVVGQKEEEEGVVSVRSRFAGDEGQKPLAEFIDAITKEIRTKEFRQVTVEQQ